VDRLVVKQDQTWSLRHDWLGAGGPEDDSDVTVEGYDPVTNNVRFRREGDPELHVWSAGQFVGAYKLKS
jgi:hypothetical protein